MGKVVKFPSGRVLQSDEARVRDTFRRARKRQIRQVLIVGYDEDGDFVYLSSHPSMREVTMLMQHTKTYIDDQSWT